jgi:hypothetical protein
MSSSSLVHQPVKPCTSLVINPVMTTVWPNGLSFRLKLSWKNWRLVYEPQIFRLIYSSNRDGMAMGSSPSQIININIEHFDILTLDSAQHKPSLCLCYIDDTFVVWPHRPEQLQNFLSHLNSFRPAIHFTIGIKPNSDSFSEWSGHQEGEDTKH